ncbi:hypothetical protein [Haloimpatiens massiliensis]|nr:hypothetical protein [Haloimpatiens massiliensis]
MSKIKDCINSNIEDIVKLYFKGYSVKEAIGIIRERSIKKSPLQRA